MCVCRTKTPPQRNLEKCEARYVSRTNWSWSRRACSIRSADWWPSNLQVHEAHHGSCESTYRCKGPKLDEASEQWLDALAVVLGLPISASHGNTPYLMDSDGDLDPPRHPDPGEQSPCTPCTAAVPLTISPCIQSNARRPGSREKMATGRARRCRWR
jgi:hypothetical protein